MQAGKFSLALSPKEDVEMKMPLVAANRVDWFMDRMVEAAD